LQLLLYYNDFSGHIERTNNLPGQISPLIKYGFYSRSCLKVLKDLG
jgi:hypothetical protein